MSKIILPVVYGGNLSYCKVLLDFKESVILDIHEHFIKQSYRNRMEIHGANGKLSLIIPLKKRKERTPMKDVLIEYKQDWQKLHWKSLESAYRSSPYFEFYEHQLKHFYDKTYQPKYLIDFNLNFLKSINEMLGVSFSIKKSKEYNEVEGLDFRKMIHPKIEFIHGEEKKYDQVFDLKNGFISNLSVLDLIFNEGPNSLNLLHQFI